MANVQVRSLPHLMGKTAERKAHVAPGSRALWKHKVQGLPGQATVLIRPNISDSAPLSYHPPPPTSTAFHNILIPPPQLLRETAHPHC
ncbi:hypothetical protein SKAU_G00349260 [Synaphobranchus kaupii]|uniref:Uncharacterized protein n=1 Tax=Synaphobranchus kaupii TaxID=118154 RepID=A0A9Q1EKA9_SYNKA|nr:hypothetical protein SKAU_G00349260 [Synaphobranchus kaupii]